MGNRKKQKKPDKTVIQVIVEGSSDMEALHGAFEELFEQIDEHYETDFIIPAFDEWIAGSYQYSGDITSYSNVTPQNIERVIVESGVQRGLDKKEYFARDIAAILHIVDLDGAFIPDKNIREKPSAQKPIYRDKTILTKNPSGIQNRNKHKSENLCAITSWKYITVSSSQGSIKGTYNIPYRVFYFSSNLDHFLYGEANLAQGVKKDYAIKFALKYDTLEAFTKFINSISEANANASYEESWNQARQDLNSLSRGSNINILINGCAKNR